MLCLFIGPSLTEAAPKNCAEALLEAVSSSRVAGEGVVGSDNSDHCGPRCAWNLIGELERELNVKLPRHSDPTHEFDVLRRLSGAYRNSPLEGFGAIETLLKYIDEKLIEGELPFDIASVYRYETRRRGIIIDDLDGVGRRSIIWVIPQFSGSVTSSARESVSLGDRRFFNVVEVDRAGKRMNLFDPTDGIVKKYSYTEQTDHEGLRTLRLDADPLSQSQEGTSHFIVHGALSLTERPAQRLKLWIERSKGLSPAKRSVELITEPFVAVAPEWPNDYMDQNVNYGKDVIDRTSSQRLILVPKSKFEGVRSLLHQMKVAPTYEQGIAILRTYMTSIGLIEHFPRLTLIHGSAVAPADIQSKGLLSSQELHERGLSHSRWGQNLGDGIYFVGITGWEGGTSSWGQHQYSVTYDDVDLLRGSNQFLGAFVKIYDAYRQLWGLSRYDDDSILVPGLADSILSYSGSLARLPSIYADLNVIGVSSVLEIFIKKRIIPPAQIRVLK